MPCALLPAQQGQGNPELHELHELHRTCVKSCCESLENTKSHFKTQSFLKKKSLSTSEPFRLLQFSRPFKHKYGKSSVISVWSSERAHSWPYSTGVRRVALPFHHLNFSINLMKCWHSFTHCSFRQTPPEARKPGKTSIVGMEYIITYSL